MRFSLKSLMLLTFVVCLLSSRVRIQEPSLGLAPAWTLDLWKYKLTYINYTPYGYGDAIHVADERGLLYGLYLPQRPRPRDDGWGYYVRPQPSPVEEN
jgi:hypothetical protein